MNKIYLAKTEHLENGFNRVQIEDWDFIKAAYGANFKTDEIPNGFNEPMFCMSCMGIFPIKMFKVKGFDADPGNVWCPSNNCKKRIVGAVIPLQLAQHMLDKEGLPAPVLSDDIITKGDYLITLRLD